MPIMSSTRAFSPTKDAPLDAAMHKHFLFRQTELVNGFKTVSQIERGVSVYDGKITQSYGRDFVGINPENLDNTIQGGISEFSNFYYLDYEIHATTTIIFGNHHILHIDGPDQFRVGTIYPREGKLLACSEAGLPQEYAEFLEKNRITINILIKYSDEVYNHLVAHVESEAAKDPKLAATLAHVNADAAEKKINPICRRDSHPTTKTESAVSVELALVDLTKSKA